MEDLLSKVDHTLLSVGCTWEQIKEICDDGVNFGTASVCIPPCYVKKAAEYLDGSGVKVCTVIGFPNGYNCDKVKAFETRCAIIDGADEIDMVINVGFLKEKNFDAVLDEIVTIRQACDEFKQFGRDIILKVIIETCLLTHEEIVKMCHIVSQSGADFIKTSTGFSTGGATKEYVALMKQNVMPHVKIKAAGGISSIEDAREFIRLGADRLGTSKVVKILKNETPKGDY